MTTSHTSNNSIFIFLKSEKAKARVRDFSTRRAQKDAGARQKRGLDNPATLLSSMQGLRIGAPSSLWALGAGAGAGAGAGGGASAGAGSSTGSDSDSSSGAQSPGIADLLAAVHLQ